MEFATTKEQEITALLVADTNTHKSTSGGLFFLGSSPISWYTLKQRGLSLQVKQNTSPPQLLSARE
jgi:hypothetical protein